MTSFDLVSRPWIPVQRLDGTTAELSLRDVFAQADGLRRLVGDVPTQEFALLRLLLAVLHDAVDGPREIEDWGDLWESDEPFAAVPDYLERHRDRFDLLDPGRPFLQVAGLRTGKDDIGPLKRIIADVPNGYPFFSMRRPDPDRLDFAEAARWLVHAHAFDVSGIKSGAVGDPRVKGGRGYPLGVGWAGNLGGVYAEGSTLKHTLLLNLISADNDFLQIENDDKPVWRRPSLGPAAIELTDVDERRPSGPRDLYTWQSRRIRLHHDGGGVTGVVLCYGDPLAVHDRNGREPMTGWRDSPAQAKKLGRQQVRMPRQHDPNRAAWRGLATLLVNRGHALESTEQRQKAETFLPPGVVQWLSRLTVEGYLPRRSLLRTRTVGAAYGTQQSVIDEITEDEILLPVVVLNEGLPEYAVTAVAAVSDADSAVTALGHLAANLARATGSDHDSAAGKARDLGFAALDGPYRQWLGKLGDTSDPAAYRGRWQETVGAMVRVLGRGLLDSAGPAAAEGRYVDLPDGGGTRWLNDAQAELWFLARLKKVLPLAPRTAAGPAGEPAGEDGGGGTPYEPGSPEPSAAGTRGTGRTGDAAEAGLSGDAAAAGLSGDTAEAGLSGDIPAGPAAAESLHAATEPVR